MPSYATLNTRDLPFVAKLIAKAIDVISGGTANQPATWSPTPDQIDYVIGQLTSGEGREIGKLFHSSTGSSTIYTQLATRLNCPVCRGIAVQFPLESLSKCRGIRSMRLGQLIQPRQGLKPSGKLPESGR